MGGWEECGSHVLLPAGQGNEAGLGSETERKDRVGHLCSALVSGVSRSLSRLLSISKKGFQAGSLEMGGIPRYGLGAWKCQGRGFCSERGSLNPWSLRPSQGESVLEVQC